MPLCTSCAQFCKHIFRFLLSSKNLFHIAWREEQDLAKSSEQQTPHQFESESKLQLPIYAGPELFHYATDCAIQFRFRFRSKQH